VDIHAVNTVGGVQANITTLQSSQLNKFNMIAGRWRVLSTPIWSTSKTPMFTILTAYNHYEHNDKDNALDIVYIIANKRRLIKDVIFFATNTELSMLVQLQDVYGDYVAAKIQQVFYLQGVPVVPALPPDQSSTIIGQYIQDGWWGQHYNQVIPTTILTVTLVLTTYNDLNQTQLDRSHTYLSYTLSNNNNHRRNMNNQFHLGNQLYICPRMAHTEGHVILQLITPTLPQLDVISCLIHVSQSRMSFITINSSYYIINITVESLLRSRDVQLLLLSNMTKRAQFYDFFDKDDEVPCPQPFYFSKFGKYELLPPHAFTEDCYDFQCESGFEKTSQDCQVISTLWYYTVVGLVLFFVFAWGSCVTFTAVFTKVMSEPVVEVIPEEALGEGEEEDFDMEGVLPIAVTTDGQLEFEIESVSSSSSSSLDDLDAPSFDDNL
jgi:hypothetical protein